MDNLTYKYKETNELSNKLLAVNEVNNVDNKLGDFNDKNTTFDDYDYDLNGNLVEDRNKSITSISYNILNLPKTIVVSGKGSIDYQYDAAGNKLTKIIHESGHPDKASFYLPGGFVYQDQGLEFIPQEEGRIRLIKNASGVYNGHVYDYFIKDHLGNVRSVVTEEQALDVYPTLTFESNSQTEVDQQNAVWENKDGNPIDVVNSHITQPGQFINSDINSSYSMLVRRSPGVTNAIGAGKLLRVMSGDRIHTYIDYYYTAANADNGAADGLSSLVSNLLSVLPINNQVASVLKGDPTLITNSFASNTDLVALVNQPPSQSGSLSAPKAYLSIIFFDEQFNLDKNASRVFPISYTPNTPAYIDKRMSNAITAGKNGYVYVYFSNESNEMVYFDNFILSHEHGPLLEETHYYPFGLTIAGINSKALAFGSPENKYKYQEHELNSDFDINLYETQYRSLDPQIGRFWQIDPKPAESISLYASMENNPISKIDLLGDTTSYYTSNGQFWFTSNDNLKNSIVIISEKNEEAFFRHFYDTYARVPDKKRDINAMNRDLRRFGIGYDIASFEKFYGDNGKSVPAKTVNGVSTEGWTDITLNGKPSKLYAEVQGNLVMKDGMVTVGKEKQSDGEMTQQFPSDLPSEPGKIGHIHTHPIAVITNLDYRKGNIYSGGGFPIPGPSGADQTNVGNNRGGVRNVVVDSKNVYLINGNSAHTIKIPRR